MAHIYLDHQSLDAATASMPLPISIFILPPFFSSRMISTTFTPRKRRFWCKKFFADSLSFSVAKTKQQYRCIEIRAGAWKYLTENGMGTLAICCLLME